MNQEVKQKWIDALRSGKYQQGYHALHPTPDSYCCLGVLCDLHAEENSKLWDLRGFGTLDTTYLGSSAVPTDVEKWADLHLIERAKLVKLNDCDRFSFNEIADVIEKEL